MKNGDWYKVKLNGITGYVHKDYSKIEEDKQEEKKEETVQEEKQETNNEDIEEVAEAPSEMKVSKDVNLYILPLINSNVLENVKKDVNVRIISKTNGWAYVETENNVGWIRLDILVDSSVVSDDINVDEDKNDEEKPEEVKDTSDDKEITSKIMYVNTSSIYVRKGPSTDTEVIDSLVLNATVKVIAENGDWYKVEVDGKTGYIAKRLLSTTKTETEAETTSRGKDERKDQEVQSIDTSSAYSSKGEEIVAFAKKYLGCKYVYGASGPSTFDCSGFTMFVFEKFGVTLSHSATAQSKVGTYVAKQNLKPGDLVFFTDYETGEGIGHCGIYIGNGEFIHASSGTGYCVKTSTLLTGSYYNRYETARRVL